MSACGGMWTTSKLRHRLHGRCSFRTKSIDDSFGRAAATTGTGVILVSFGRGRVGIFVFVDVAVDYLVFVMLFMEFCKRRER